MTDDNVLLQILKSATEPGEAVSPSGLLQLLEADPDPIQALADIDRSNALFAAFAAQFSFGPSLQLARSLIAPEDRAKAVALMRWLMRELHHWTDVHDPHRYILAAMFVVTASLKCDDRFWNALPDSLGENSDFARMLEELVSRTSFTFRQRGSPLSWENEAVDSFRLADSKRDWPKIAEKWHLFENGSFPNVLLVQAVGWLYRYRFDRLVRAVENVAQTPIAMAIAGALSSEQRLRLANAGSNQHIQFSSTYLTISRRNGPPRLAATEQNLLTQVLLKVGLEADRWKSWMETFNRYPMRHPRLQPSLGIALASISEAGVGAYVESIELHRLPPRPDDSRRCIAACLREFKRAASIERRQLLWTLAHARWTTWDFDRTNCERYLFEISWSQIDYAIVAYSSECIDQETTEQQKARIDRALDLVPTTWHESLSSCTTAWYRLLSQFQPYAHAGAVGTTDEDWLQETQIYFPSGSVSDYAKALFTIG